MIDIEKFIKIKKRNQLVFILVAIIVVLATGNMMATIFIPSIITSIISYVLLIMIVIVLVFARMLNKKVKKMHSDSIKEMDMRKEKRDSSFQYDDDDEISEEFCSSPSEE